MSPTELFGLRLILSFIVGFVWITALSIFAERLGTRLGGLIAGIPATMVVALVFIGITTTPAAAVQATISVPFVVGINALFTVLYVYLARKFSAAAALSLALGAWVIAAALFTMSNMQSFTLSIVGYIIFLIVTYLLFAKLQIKEHSSKKMKYTPFQIVIRGGIGGVVIAGAVLAAHFSGPLLAGVLASFPALTVALIIITRMQHDASFTAALLRSFIIGGTVNVIAFVILVRYTYIPLGILWGTTLGMIGSIMTLKIGHVVGGKS